MAISARGAVSNVAVPTLRRVAPARPGPAAVLVAGGGGYKRIENGTEAEPAARWLAERGITAFVLTYRLPTEGWRDGPLAPLQDAQEALRQLGRSFERVGVLGFSAGGHLLGLAAAGERVHAAALAYPVITLEPPYDHTSTRRSLVGAHPMAEAAAQWSVQTHVGPDYPPTFLVQAADDPIADPANTAIMEAACRRAGVPVERHLLASGGHGFGMGRPGTPTADWPALYEPWLRRVGLIASASRP